MLINALQRADEGQRAELDRWIAAVDYVPEEKVRAVTALYDAIGIKEVCHRKIESYFQAAEACLDKVSVEESRKQELRNFALSLMGRKV